MATFNLYLRQDRKRRDGKMPIYVVATYGRAYKIPLKLYTDSWNNKTNLPKDLHLKNYCIRKLQAIEQAYLERGFDLDYFKRLVLIDKTTFLSDARSVADKINNRKNNKAYNTAINSWESFAGDTKPTEQLIVEYKKWLSSNGITLNSQSVYLRTLRSIWNKLNYQHNPFKGLVPKPTRTQKKALGVDEIRHLKEIDNKFADWWLLMYYMCGINAIDLFYAKKNQLQGEYLTFKRTKLGARSDEHKIWVCPPAMELIKKYNSKDSDLLLNWGEKINTAASYGTWLKRFNYGLKKIGITDLTTNTARHTFATIARDRGVSIDIIAHLLGHTDNRVTSIYIDTYPDEVLRQAILKCID